LRPEIACAGFFAIAGCTLATTPRVQDSLAPHDTYTQAVDKEPPCERRVELVRSPSVPALPYQVVGSLSATFYPGAPGLCERRLLARACEIKADAVMLNEPERGGTPPGASAQSAISMSGRAVRWK
jgi:hypothetical protein